MPTLEYKHPTVNSDGQNMGSSRVTTKFFSPGGQQVTEVFTDRNAGVAVVLPVPMTPEQAAAASGGTSQSVVTAIDLGPSEPLMANAPAVVNPTKAGQPTDFVYRNS